MKNLKAKLAVLGRAENGGYRQMKNLTGLTSAMQWITFKGVRRQGK